MHTSREVKQSPQYRVLEEYIANGLALDDALHAFCEKVETKYRDTQNSDYLEEPLWQAWRAVVAMAACEPHSSDSRQKLADFVLAVQKRSALIKDGEACMVQDARVWQDLPVFGMEMREAWNLGASQSTMSRIDLTDRSLQLSNKTAALSSKICGSI